MNTENAILIRTKLNAPTINNRIIKRTKVFNKLEEPSPCLITAALPEPVKRLLHGDV
jgi:hypothetical protein